MGGATKGLLDLLGRPILDTLEQTLQPIFQDVLLVAKESLPYGDYLQGRANSFRLVLDTWEHRSSLTGIHAALTHCSADHCFVTACDTPLVRPALLKAMLQLLRPEDDVVLPRKPDGYFEPLCAIYSKRCLPFVDAQLQRGQFKIVSFFNKVHVHPLPTDILLQCDPELVSFQNANTPEDLSSLRQWAAKVLSPGAS
jgi:molybdopterin-guanine dinucleotide biosynthesis protein A